jgi:hypothetical protein
MAHGGPSAVLTFSTLKQHNGFSGISAGFKKSPSVLDGFQVKADNRRIHILQN